MSRYYLDTILRFRHKMRKIMDISMQYLATVYGAKEQYTKESETSTQFELANNIFPAGDMKFPVLCKSS